MVLMIYEFLEQINKLWPMHFLLLYMFHNPRKQKIHTRLLTILNQNIHKTKTRSGGQKMIWLYIWLLTECTIEDEQMPSSKGADGTEGYRWNG
jgi:hypothetical protein